MSRVMTYSRVFPSYHPRAGEPTYFVEKILKGLPHTEMYEPEGLEIDLGMMAEAETKHHTIRAGHRWKVGDKFSPRVWSGKPYQSKQIIIAPDIEIKKLWNFEVVIDKKSGYESVRLNDVLLHEINGDQVFMGGHYKWKAIAQNDGLEFDDFCDWFNKSFSGQIICYNDQIEY